MKRINRIHYLIASKDEVDLENKVKDLMLIHTGARDSEGNIVKEFKVRNLLPDELKQMQEEDLLPIIANQDVYGIDSIEW